jgi:polyisoprenoid-binding protein YceI
MNRRIFTAFAAALLLTGTAAFAQSSTWAIDKNHSQVDFQIRHLGLSNVRGTLSGLVGTFVWDDKDISKSSVTVTIDATTVDTSTAARDKHLKSPDFFNVDKYPTLAGVTKPVTLDVDGPVPPQAGQNGKIVTGFSATGTLKRSDFTFGPKFAPPVLGDEVKFTIDVEAAKQ